MKWVLILVDREVAGVVFGYCKWEIACKVKKRKKKNQLLILKIISLPSLLGCL